MNKKSKMPDYIMDLIKKNPNIVSGRKNFDNYNLRILKTLNLIKKYFKKTNN